MKVVGTIVEYNPFHNGHLYAIQEIKKRSNADILVVVMSGDFTMRGDLSLFNKFEKTKQCLKAGIDLIIELPFVYTVHNADIFAKRAIELLALAKVDELWFGSETDDKNNIINLYNEWYKEHNQEKIKHLLKEGLSYKAATAKIIDLNSNDLLGFCYYKAIKDLNLKIKINTIKRMGSNFNDLIPNQYASAYSIRNNLDLINDYCPNFIDKTKIRNWDSIFIFLKFTILNQTPSELKKYFMVDEGIENKLYQIINYHNFNDFVDFLATKRYTKSRIQRMLLYVFFNITKEQMVIINKEKPNFLRILGFSDKGLIYLKDLKKEILILTNLKNNLNSVLDINLKITKILDLFYLENEFKLEQSAPIRE